MAAVNCVTTKMVVSTVHVDEDFELKALINQSLVKTLTNVQNRDHATQRMESVETSCEVINAPVKRDINFFPIKEHALVNQML